MSFLFNIPDSLKKNPNTQGSTDNTAQNRGFQRPTTNYADLDDPTTGDAPSAPERRPRLSNLLQDRSKFSLRRAADGSIVPKPTMPPRTAGSQMGGPSRPQSSQPQPARGTLTRAGLIPAGARNQYTLKRTGPGKPSVPERHPSPAAFSGGSADEGGGEDEEDRGPSNFTRSQTVKFAPGSLKGSLFGGTVAEGSATERNEQRGLFASGRSQSPSRPTQRRREASPMYQHAQQQQPPPPQLPTRAASGAQGGSGAAQAEGRGSSGRTLTAHDLTGMRNVNDVAKQLRKLIGRSCPADFDRYQLLDERDKLLCKLREIKPSFFSKTGSCKDMCPEKERYVRVVQMRVADYEMDMLGEMEPRRMVKEYSRSAADQEEPLEHEMRPPEVLEMTMEYLLTDIVDSTIEASPDSSKWYDFLWNRTRAIRKELTQQMILNESAVRLIECCTRMHMFAGYSLGRLRQEEFDPKMNDENLSKCLQSLRHLYEDLAKKEIFVESEAEFRAYDVMLHLTDSNILRQVLSYRRSVRESPAVRLALKLFSAIQSSNYTRFFRLVREQATFAQCCILYRYFGKMRLHAFSTMVTAYKGGTIPMQLIARLLAFENEEQAIEVAAQYELSYTQDAAGVPALLPESRDFNPAVGEVVAPAHWIDGKREGKKLSEIFRGGPARLSTRNADTPPVDSFDPATATYSYDPVLSEYLGRLGNAAPDDPFASANLARVQQKRAEIVVERAAGAAAAAPPAPSSKPAFGGMLSSFGKQPAAPTAAPGGGLGTGAPLFSSLGAKPGGSSSFGSGIVPPAPGASTTKTMPSFGGFGGKPVAPGGFSFSGASTATTDTSTAGDKKPLFGLKQESDTVSKLQPKKEPGEGAARVQQTAERLFEGVIDDETKKIVRERVSEEQETRKKKQEEHEKKEMEKIKKEQQEREEQAEAARVAAAAKSAEKRRQSKQARISACADHLFRRVLWPSLVKEVIDPTTRAIAAEVVAAEEKRMADGLARYKQRMHALWLRQFTDRWREYVQWKKEQRQRVRRVLEAVVCRNPFEGISAASLKRRLSAPDSDDVEAKRRRRYGNVDPLTALAIIGFVERRQARIARTVVGHWREWAERRARRKAMMRWPLNRAVPVPRLRPPTPTDDEDYGSTSLPLVEESGGHRGLIMSSKRQEKRHKSRRSMGLYPFLAADDSFLDGRATPLGGATPVRDENEEGGREGRRPRVSDIFNSTAMPDTTAHAAIGFQTFVGRQEQSAVSEDDVEYATALMEQSRWAVGEGARERWRRREARGGVGGQEERRRDEWMSRPLESEAAAPSWRGLFDALNDEDGGKRGGEREAMRALETPQPLNESGRGWGEMTMRRNGEAEALDRTVLAPLQPQQQQQQRQLLPWEKEELEERERIAARNAAIDAQLAESKRLREAAAADRARQDALLASMGC